MLGLAQPVSPAGTLAGPPPELRWDDTTAAGASWYYLSIDSGDANIWQRWVRREDTVADGGDRYYTLSGALPAGDYTWRIQTWLSPLYGPQSDPLGFTVE
jgi:hypothetical protein